MLSGCSTIGNGAGIIILYIGLPLMLLMVIFKIISKMRFQETSGIEKFIGFIVAGFLLVFLFLIFYRSCN